MMEQLYNLNQGDKSSTGDEFIIGLLILIVLLFFGFIFMGIAIAVLRGIQKNNKQSQGYAMKIVDFQYGLAEHQKVIENQNFELRQGQAKSLLLQEGLLMEQRRDVLKEEIEQAHDLERLNVLREDIDKHPRSAQEMLLRELRKNMISPLPGTAEYSCVEPEVLGSQAVSDYIAGLEKKGLNSGKNFALFSYEILAFMKTLALGNVPILSSDLKILEDFISGQFAQDGHAESDFYRKLINMNPEIAIALLEGRAWRAGAGDPMKYSVLSGVLDAIGDSEKGKGPDLSIPFKTMSIDQHQEIAKRLGLLLKFGVFEFNDEEYASEHADKLASHLVKSVGILARVAPEEAERMVEHLADALWTLNSGKLDKDDVLNGFDLIASSHPELWEKYGQELGEIAMLNMKGEIFPPCVDENDKKDSDAGNTSKE